LTLLEKRVKVKCEPWGILMFDRWTQEEELFVLSHGKTDYVSEALCEENVGNVAMAT